MKHLIPNWISIARRALGFALALFAAAQVSAASTSSPPIQTNRAIVRKKLSNGAFMPGANTYGR